MPQATLYLPEDLRQAALAGNHNFLARLLAVLNGAGMKVALLPEPRGPLAWTRARLRDDWPLVHMGAPIGPRGLTFRRVYHYPFWQIERSAARWDWDVARAEFEPPSDQAETKRFFGFWQRRLFGEAPLRAQRAGMIYVALQGRIRERRSFQSCAPIAMLREVLDHAGDREVRVGLHPGEVYSAADRAALSALNAPRLRIVEGGMVEGLSLCDMVVTQNSSVAFNGYFFGKPAVLCARIDFHHIALDAGATGLGAAMAAAAGHRPDYAGYVTWFWQKMSLNAGRPEIEERIATRVRALGWPV